MRVQGHSGNCGGGSELRKDFSIKSAIVFYLGDKLPDGWKIHDPTYYGCSTDMEDYIFLFKDLRPGRRLGIPVLLNLENPEKSAQNALHAVWGTHEMGYEIWEARNCVI